MNEIGTGCGIFNMGSSYGTPEGEITQQDLQSYVKRADANKLAFKGSIEGRTHHMEDCADWPLLAMQGYGESEQVQTTGAQLIDFETASLKFCTLLDADTGTLKCNIVNDNFSSIQLTNLSEQLMSNKGKTIRFQCHKSNSDTFMSIVVYGTRTDGQQYQEVSGSQGSNYCELIIDNEFTEISQIDIRFNRKNTVQTDTTTIYSGLMLYFKEDSTILPFEPYTGAAPSPSADYPQEIESKCQVRQLFDINGDVNRQQNGATIFAPEQNGSTVADNVLTLNATQKTAYAIGQIFSGFAGKTLTFSAELLSLGAATSVIMRVHKIGESTPIAASTFPALGKNSLTFTVPEDAEQILVGFIGTVTEEVVANAKITNIMLNEGAEPGAWAPYGKFGLETVVTGAQLITYPFKESTLTRNGVTFTDNGDGSVIVNGTATADSSFYINFGKTLVAGTYTLSGCPAGGSINGYSLCFGSASQADLGAGITRDINGETFNIYIRVKSGTTVNNVVFRPMLNAGDTAKSWQPYTTQNLHTYLETPIRGIPVSSGGNVTIDGQQYITDERDWERGKHIQRVAELVLDGSETYLLQSINANGIANFVYDLPASGKVLSGLQSLCNMFRWNSGAIASVTEEGFFNNDARAYFRINSSTASTVDEFKVYLAQNNIQLQYVLATPIETDIPTEELADYSRLHAYYGTTNISNSDDVHTAVTYARDPDLYINQKFAEISAQML